jgi:hypothetical protein
MLLSGGKTELKPAVYIHQQPLIPVVEVLIPQKDVIVPGVLKRKGAQPVVKLPVKRAQIS